MLTLDEKYTQDLSAAELADILLDRLEHSNGIDFIAPDVREKLAKILGNNEYYPS